MTGPSNPATASGNEAPAQPNPLASPNRLGALVPVGLIALLYFPVHDFDAVWDDGHLSFARVYRDCDLGAIFTTAANTFEYLPVRDLTLCIDHALWGSWPGGFHLQNVVIFMLSCVLLGSLARSLFAASEHTTIARNAPLLALASATVFAAHPLQIEPVAFITARNALLALLFLVAALHAVERHVTTGKPVFYVMSIVATVLALFSKATALPTALIVALTFAYLRRQSGPWQVLRYAAPHLAVTALATVLHATIASSHGALGSGLSLGEVVSRLPRAAFVPQFYLYKFVWPVKLSTDYVLDDVRTHIVWFALGALLFAAAVGFVLVRGARKRTTVAFFLAAFVAALIPVSNLFPTHPPVADRYAQIPIAFLAPLAVALLALRLPLRAVAAIAAVWILTLSALSVRQLPSWRNDETLFAQAAAVDERAVQSIENLAYTQWLRDKPEAALASFARYAAQVENDGQYELFQAWHAVRTGDVATAETGLDVASRKSVPPYLVHVVRAEIAEAQGRKRRMQREYERAREAARKRFQRDARARVYLHLVDRRLREIGTR